MDTAASQAQIALNDSEFHTFHATEAFARLRREDPVHWHAPLRTWVLTKHADVRYASREPALFSVSRGIRLDDARYESQSAEGIFAEGGEFLAFTDPPRHGELRRVLAPSFTPRAVAARQARIRQLAAMVADRIPPGEPIEWVSLAARLPVMVGLDLLGLPLDDVDLVRGWSDAMERLSYPLEPEELAQVFDDFAPLGQYLTLHVDRRRHESPADDMISLLLHEKLDGHRLSDANIIMFLQSVLGAGNDTMRSTLSGQVVALAQHPEQLRRLVDDRSLVPNAVEELQRWITPARGFMRTVMQPTKLRDKCMSPGEHVYLAYDSANRDEEVFERADQLDVTRHFGPQQASFGFGTHVCIAAAFARFEAAAMLDELLDRFDDFELVQPPTPVVSVLRNGWHDAHVVFRPSRPQ